MKLNAFETYCLFLSLKNHFNTDSYDYFKYSGKVSAKVDTFMLRKDRFQFQRLSSRYSETELRDYIIANLLQDKTWIGDFLKDDAKKNYEEYVKVKESLTYIFQSEVSSLFKETGNAQKAFASEEGEYPPVLLFLIRKKLSFIVFAILSRYVDFIPKLDQRLKNDITWSKISKKTKKLIPFIPYDKHKILSALTNSINSIEN